MTQKAPTTTISSFHNVAPMLWCAFYHANLGSSVRNLIHVLPVGGSQWLPTIQIEGDNRTDELKSSRSPSKRTFNPLGLRALERFGTDQNREWPESVERSWAICDTIDPDWFKTP